MSVLLAVTAILMLFFVIFQIAKAGEYVSILRGKEKSFRDGNRVNAKLMIAFLVLGLIGVYACHKLLYDKTLFAQGSSSIEGERVDSMLIITTIICMIVFVITQILLFWFSYKYQYKEDRKIKFLPHNNKLEIIWTVVPTIVLTVLIIFGLRSWFLFTGEAPKGALEVEITGKQFGWIIRYPGADNVFGKKYFKNIDATNSLGLNWTDNAEFNQKADPAAQDDIVVEGTMMIIKGRPVKFIIGSRDVIHNVGLPHFRLKADAVPGTPTTLWFTPKYTTEEMKVRTGNPNFAYEIACDQMCGNGHYSMKATILVVDEKEYNEKIAAMSPAYKLAYPDPDTQTNMPAQFADSVATELVIDSTATAKK